MRSLVAALLLALAIAPVASPAAGPVLGVDWSVAGQRLAWFDPQTMRALPGRKAPLGFHVGSWSFSTDRGTLAVGGTGASLRFVDARRMRVLGDVRLAAGGNGVAGVSWLRPDRLIAFVRRPGDTTAVVVDPQRRSVLRRVALGGQLEAIGRLVDGVAVLLRPEDGIGPAQVALVDVAGSVRRAAVDRIPIGAPLQVDEGEIARTASAGFAVDPATRTAWVVGASALAQVDLVTLAVSYRSSPRQLAKASEGPFRTARWLGGGLIAVAGGANSASRRADGTLDTRVEPYGLRLLDVASGTSRTIDPSAAWFDPAGGLLLVRSGDEAVVAYDRQGAERLRIALGRDTWVNAAGATALVCRQRELVAVVDLSSGARAAAGRGAVCADLLAGPASDY